MPTEIEVCIPAYNEALSIGITIASINAQQPTDEYHFRTLVIPNGCSDNTAQVAREAIAGLPPHPSISFEVVELDEASKPKALNAALGRCATNLFMYADADVTFSERCFEQVADRFRDNRVQAGGAVPRLMIPPDLEGTYLGQVLRMRQLYEDASGSRMLPIGRMIAFRKDAFSSFVEDIASEDTWVVSSIAQQHGWDTIQIAEEASVYAVAPSNWDDFIDQESRFACMVKQLHERSPELEAVIAQKRRTHKQHVRSRSEVEEIIKPTVEKEGLSMDLIDELEIIRKIIRDNSRLMPELISRTGRWEPTLSTKLPVSQDAAGSSKVI